MKNSKPSNRPRVAIILHNYDPSHEGMSISVTRLAENMGDKVDLHLIMGYPTSDKLDFLRTTIRTEKKSTYFLHRIHVNLNEKTTDYVWGLENLFFAINNLHEKYSFDVLHAYYANPAGYIATLAGKRNHIPVVVGIRGNDITRDVFVPEKFGWTNWVLENADHLTFLNAELLSIADSISSIGKKGEVVTNSSYYPFEFKPKKKGNRPFTLGYIGDVKRKKGFIYLLEALTRVSPNVHLAVTGKVYDSEKKTYGDFIRRNNLTKRVRFTGEVDHEKLGSCYGALDCLVLPTIADGCPNVIFEGMKLKVPIISTNNTAISQILKNGKDAILVEARDTEALAKAIHFAHRNPSKIKKMAENAFKRLDQFEVEDECNSYLRIYRRLIGKKHE